MWPDSGFRQTGNISSWRRVALHADRGEIDRINPRTGFDILIRKSLIHPPGQMYLWRFCCENSVGGE